MIESDTFESIKKPINKIQAIIDDPLLSEFKYHFIIKKLPIFNLIYDKNAWSNFIPNIYKGFIAPYIGHNSIHIVQILNVWPEMKTCDLIVGFRNDQQALSFYKDVSVFEFDKSKYEIQVADGFKTFLDQLNQKCRQEAAQRQKIRAQENQQLLRISDMQQKPKSPISFVRQTSNPISVYQSKSQNPPLDMCPEQGQIIDTPRKQTSKRKNSSSASSSSVSSRSRSSSKSKKYKRNQKDRSSSESRSNRFNRKRNSQNNKNYRQESSSRSTSSRKSSRSESSSESSRGRGQFYRRNERSRDMRSYKRGSSSSYSSDSSYKKNSADKRRSYSRMDESRRRREDKGQKYQGDKYEENRKYEIYQTPSYNRSYSSNYNDRGRQGIPDMTKKLSYDPYSAYRAPGGRYEGQYNDYQKQGSSSGYYKNVPGYTLPKSGLNSGDSKSAGGQYSNRYTGSNGGKNYY